MTSTTPQHSSGDAGTGLPRPRRGGPWRWSRPRHALVAGGALAAVLSLAVATGGGAGAATAAPGNSGAARGGPMTRPTVAGKVTAVKGDDITLKTDATTTVTVVTSSSTTFKVDPGPGRGTTSSGSALKAGDFIGVQGTKNSDGSVTASSITIGRSFRAGKGGPGGGAGSGKGGKPPAGAPSA
jgi:hypothetical protein